MSDDYYSGDYSQTGEYSPYTDTSDYGQYDIPYQGFQPQQMSIPGPGSMGQGSAVPQGQQANPWLGAGLGAAGPLAGLLGALFDPSGGGQSPPLSRGQRTAAGAAQGTLGQMGTVTGPLFGQGANLLSALGPQFAQGQNPMQQQQQGILSALAPTASNLASGVGGLSPELLRTIEMAFQPQMGNIATQAIESARNRGFAGGADLLNTGPGGAIAGPALSDLQGQMAQQKLQMMLQMPQTAANLAGAYNQPIAQQGNFANQFSQAMMGPQQNVATGLTNLFGSYPSYRNAPKQTGENIGQDVAGLLGGAAQGYAGVDMQNQNQQFRNSMLQAIQGMSGTRPQYGG